VIPHYYEYKRKLIEAQVNREREKMWDGIINGLLELYSWHILHGYSKQEILETWKSLFVGNIKKMSEAKQSKEEATKREATAEAEFNKLKEQIASYDRTHTGPNPQRAPDVLYERLAEWDLRREEAKCIKNDADTDIDFWDRMRALNLAFSEKIMLGQMPKIQKPQVRIKVEEGSQISVDKKTGKIKVRFPEESK